jgi:hypothetical protein
MVTARNRRAVATAATRWFGAEATDMSCGTPETEQKAVERGWNGTVCSLL